MRSVDDFKRGITQAVATVTSAILKNTREKFERCWQNKRESGGGGHVETWIVFYFLLSIIDLQKDI